jgi:hypothetical protein
MNTPDKNLIEEVALVKGISEAFVEKDWYVTQVIRKVSKIRYEDFQVIFTGGTALSKAHGLIQRFSEDIDFRVITSSLVQKSRSEQKRLLSAFKHAVIAELRTTFQVDDAHIMARNENRFFSVEINYPTSFDPSTALRPHILVEFTITDLALPPIHVPVSSFINELSSQPPEVESIGCTDPVENATDKLSAIVWRIPERERGQSNDDPDVVRHIHDLSILSDRAIAHSSFKTLAIEIINRDDQRSSKIAGLPIDKKFETVLGILSNEQEYLGEYDRFVKGMSYAPDSVVPSFAQALEKLRLVIKHIL